MHGQTHIKWHSLFPTLTTTVFPSGICQWTQSTCYCRRLLHGCHNQQVCEHNGYI